MDEPGRIGLTAEAGAQLEDLLADLNPLQGDGGKVLIKMDLYRLAVANGLKIGVHPPKLKDKSIPSFRVSELDENGVLHTAVEKNCSVEQDFPIYGYIERLAEYGIREFYSSNLRKGELPYDELFL